MRWPEGSNNARVKQFRADTSSEVPPLPFPLPPKHPPPASPPPTCVRSRVKRSRADSPSGLPPPGGASMVRIVSSSSFLVSASAGERMGFISLANSWQEGHIIRAMPKHTQWGDGRVCPAGIASEHRLRSTGIDTEQRSLRTMKAQRPYLLAFSPSINAAPPSHRRPAPPPLALLQQWSPPGLSGSPPGPAVRLPAVRPRLLPRLSA